MYFLTSDDATEIELIELAEEQRLIRYRKHEMTQAQLTAVHRLIIRDISESNSQKREYVS